MADDRGRLREVVTSALPQPLLVGRDAELSALIDLVDLSARGHLEVGLIEGEAGIGKSALVGEIAARAADRGVAVLRGRADGVEQGRPFGPLAEALDLFEDAADPARRAAAAILTGAGRIGADPAAAFVEAAAELLEIEAQRGPVLLIIEDIHWADPSTLVALRRTVHRLSDLPLLLLGTFRPLPRPSQLDRWLNQLSDEAAVSVPLGPLTDAALETLAAEMRGTPAGPSLSRQLGRAGGNPLFAIEVIRAFDDETLGGEPALPESLSGMVLRRFEGLSPAARELLDVASTLGSEFRVVDLATVVGREPAELLPEIREALTSRTLRETAGGLAFSHDVVREALYAGIPQPARAALHASVATAFALAGLPPLRVACHLLVAEPGESEAWLDLVIEVATALRQSAPGMSADLLQRAIKQVGPRHPRHRELLRGSLWPLILRGRFEEVDALVAAFAAGQEDALDDPTVRQAAVYRHLKRGRVDLFRADLEQLSKRALPRSESVWVSSRLAAAYVLTGDADRAADLIPVLEEASRSHPDERERVYCLTIQTLILVAQGKLPRAIKLARETAALHGRLLSNVATVYLFVAAALADGDEFADAQRAIASGLREDLEEGDLSNLSVHHFIGAWFAYQSGDWDSAVAEAETGLALYEDGGQAYTAILCAYAVLARIAVHRDDLDGAAGWVEAGRRFVSEIGPGLGFELFAWAEAHLLAATGADPAAVIATAAPAWDMAAGVRYLLSWRVVAPDLVRWALAADDRERALAVAEVVSEGARRAGGIGSADAAALQCAGLVADQAETLVDAVGRWRLGPRVVSKAQAAEDAAAAGGGVKESAADFLEEAVVTWRGLGAQRDEARCQAALRHLGVRRRARPPTGRPITGWESLTPGELRVAELLASGLTNRRIAERLFVSPHTVDTHVRHILAKLDMRSRVEVAAEVIRRNP